MSEVLGGAPGTNRPDAREQLFANAAWREHKKALAIGLRHKPSWRETWACLRGRHRWMLDGGSVDEPRYADDEPRYFCAAAFCDARRGNW